MSINKWVFSATFVCISFFLICTPQGETLSKNEVVSEVLTGPLSFLQGETKDFQISLQYETRSGSGWRSEAIFLLEEGEKEKVYVEMGPHKVFFIRSDNESQILLPEKGVIFSGKGSFPKEDSFDVRKIILKTMEQDRISAALVGSILAASNEAVVNVVTALLPKETLVENKEGKKWALKGLEDISLVVEEGSGLTEVTWGNKQNHRLLVSIGQSSRENFFPEIPEKKWITQEVERRVLERTLQRGLLRATQVEFENSKLKPPKSGVKQVEKSFLIVQNGQRKLLLSGTARERGLAHGSLLKKEIRKVVDSTLYTVGLIYSIESGKWFPSQIEEAWSRLAPFVPEEYLEEMSGMAEGAEISFEEIKQAQFFPELFHCSGFALSGKATLDGKLYHGRVLDYLTEVGLQYNAVVTYLQQSGKNSLVNIGFAGFLGSISGMNDKGIAIGEMGGDGEGLWDGMPMAFLIRKTLEEADSLEEAKSIFKNTPRTCEYYYIISDGNTNEAVGVYATPDKIDFVGLGQPHKFLPSPVENTVLLSADTRYKKLVERVQVGYGSFDALTALEIMNVGVARRDTNLHNVLFIPEDGIFYVSNAGPTKPAADMPYFKYDLNEMKETLQDNLQ